MKERNLKELNKGFDFTKPFFFLLATLLILSTNVQNALGFNRTADHLVLWVNLFNFFFLLIVFMKLRSCLSPSLATVAGESLFGGLYRD